MISDKDYLQVDFLSSIHGISSFVSLRLRAEKVEFAGFPILVADLADIIISKEAANRPQDKAVLPLIRRALREKKQTKNPRTLASKTEAKQKKATSKSSASTSRSKTLASLKKESEKDVLEQIRRLLALPMNKRTHFLRIRKPGGGSYL